MTGSAASPVVALIGVPTDIGAGTRGASMGPEALRVAGLARALQGRGCTVMDTGNLAGPANPWLPPDQGYRHLAQVVEWNRRIHAAVREQMQAGRLPMMLGGDHSLGVGSVGAVARYCHQRHQPLRVFWLDAHTDFNTVQLTPSGNIHGMPVACLCGFGPDELVCLGGAEPALVPDEMRMIGIRSVDAGEREFVYAQGLDVYDMRAIDEWGMRAVMEAALADLPVDAHVHVSFDVDFLDPGYAPGVGTTVLGGPTWREAQLCMEMLADTGRVGSVDIVELNPALDVRNATARVAVELIESLFGKRTLMGRRTGLAGPRAGVS
ncbi:MAG TPA: arginase [Castellaniella sp.]|uniref:arginase n=1 Tax=Castellaniella sp. TaxID=1955812 RepID=UPI002EE394BC